MIRLELSLWCDRLLSGLASPLISTLGFLGPILKAGRNNTKRGVEDGRQVATIPAINLNPAEGASFPNYYLSGSGPSRPTVGALIVLWKG